MHHFLSFAIKKLKCARARYVFVVCVCVRVLSEKVFEVWTPQKKRVLKKKMVNPKQFDD